MQYEFSELITYYNSGYGEQNRLSLDQAHSIEFLTTLYFLKKHLPSNCTVLDCCSGGGVYAFPLAEYGYKVTAGDLVKEHVDILNSKNKDRLLTGVPFAR